MGRRLPASIPVWEQTTYWLVFISAIAYGIYNVFIMSRDIENLHSIYGLKDSTGFMKRFSNKQDVTNYEWYTFVVYGIWSYTPLLLFYIIASRAMQFFNLSAKSRRLGNILLGIWTIWQLQPRLYLLILLLYPLSSYVLSCLGCVPLIWAFFGAAVITFNWIENNLYWLWSSEIQGYEGLLYGASFYMRCHYFALERTWALKQQAFSCIHQQEAISSTSSSTSRCTEATKYEEDSENSPTKLVKRRKSNETTPIASHASDFQDKANFISFSSTNDITTASKTKKLLYDWPVMSEVPGLLELYFYVFYVPLLLPGFIVDFKTMMEQSENPRSLTSQRLQGILWKLPRICFWICINHVMLHFLYFLAFAHSNGLQNNIDKWTLATTAYLCGQFKTNKYVVIYGLFLEVGKFDGLNLPEPPACISYLYNYSDMWRSFDRGMHGCIKRYIYIPMGGGRAGFWRQQLSSMACFLLVGFWHQINFKSLSWAILCHVEVTLEALGAFLEKTEIIQRHLMRKLSPAWDRRLRGLFSYPIFLVGTTTNQVLLVHTHFAYMYATRICLQWDSFVTLGVIAYCGIQVSKHLERLGHTKFS